MFKRIIIGLVIALSIFAAGLVGIGYAYQDQLIERLVSSLNEYIATPVEVKSIQVSAWRDFPQLAVSFEEVFIPGAVDSTQSKEYPLADIARIDFSFNLFALLRGTYELQQISLTNGSVTLLIDKEKNANYTIFRNQQDTIQSPTNHSLAFRLEQVNLNDVQVRYRDLAREQDILTYAHDVTASLQVDESVYQINTEGNLESKYIGVGSDHYFVDQWLELRTQLVYYDQDNRLLVEPSQVSLNDTKIQVQGWIDHTDQTKLDLVVEAANSDFPTLLSVLPKSLARPWQHYRSTGAVQLAGKVTGLAYQPALQLDFGCQNASFFHPDYQKKLENIYLSGSFTNGAERNSRTSDLSLNNIRATLDGKPLSGNLRLRNFRDLYLETDFKGQFSIPSLLAFYPILELETTRGEIIADVQLKGNINDLKSNQLNRRRRTQSSGIIEMKDVAFALRDSQLPFQQISGTFEVQDNHLAIRRVSGYWGHSHFSLTGQFKNAIAYALTKTHPVQIDASLRSDLVDLDELLSGKLSNSLDGNLSRSVAQDWQRVSDKQPYQLEISPRLTLNFSCDVKRLKFRRFRGRSIRGKLKLHNQLAHIQNLSVQTAGGMAYASAMVNAQRETIRTEGRTRLEGVHVDSAFYIFEDFQQDFLTARHLKGEVYATSDWRMNLNRNLQVRYPSLSAETYATIKEGELNNFEPMQRIARFVDEEQLDHLRFDDIRNYIRICDQQIHIPKMVVQSNLSDITVEGIHTFDNHIDYHFDVPMRSIHLRSAKARERSAQRKKYFGEVASDNAAPTKLFLKAQGTVEDYKISYDIPAAKVQFKENLAAEKQELKEVMKNRRKSSNYQVEVSDEYLEFEPRP
ncbi:AsmA family protein [Tunicatimonas pelagia]|uniref:AsmA family protein n=1 Tax=Tunicatimonas pelagia TaxID=931531 RepID=UPI0026670F3A|nr:AsmA-like C-terminal region-containing protein [Tunicatimonas pelagia]WKN45914.1 AsmA-like C-terminal region-containing protein [Tunicatimonas pelagia]